MSKYVYLSWGSVGGGCTCVARAFAAMRLSFSENYFLQGHQLVSNAGEPYSQQILTI